MFEQDPSYSSHNLHVVVVDCGLTSHLAIFQLYSDGTDVQFPNFDLSLYKEDYLQNF